MRITQHLQLRGRVQGVFFRESMSRECARLGINGWVRNRRDGSLEAMVQGDPLQVAALIAWARRGPPAAQVLNLEITDASGDFKQFEKLPTL